MLRWRVCLWIENTRFSRNLSLEGLNYITHRLNELLSRNVGVEHRICETLSLPIQMSMSLWLTYKNLRTSPQLLNSVRIVLSLSCTFKQSNKAHLSRRSGICACDFSVWASRTLANHSNSDVPLLCESKNRELFDLTLTFRLCDGRSDKRSKTASRKSNYRYSLWFFYLASDWLFPRNTRTFQK